MAHGFLSGPAVVRADSNFVSWLRKKPDISIPTILIRLDAILRNLQAISMPSVTNYKLTAVEDARLDQVWEARRVRDL